MRLFFNRAIRILLFTNALVMFGAAMLAPIYALFVEKVGGNLLDASLTGGVFALASGITTLAAGRYADHMKEKELIVVFGYFVMGIGYLLYTQANSIWFLLGVQVIIGFAEAFYAPAFDALFSLHLCKKKAGREWGTWESFHYFSVGFGSILGGFIVINFGFDVMFVLMALLCFLSSIYIYMLPRKVL